MTVPSPASELPPRQPATRWAALTRWFGELVKFGAVGAVAFVVDLGIFNALTHWTDTFLAAKPLTNRIIAAAIATVVSWLGNRYWTFRDRRDGRGGREFVLYAIINAAGIGIQTATLAFTRYAVHLATPLWDNIAFVAGVALAMVFRYVSYRFLVFNHTPTDTTGGTPNPAVGAPNPPVGAAHTPITKVAALPED